MQGIIPSAQRNFMGFSSGYEKPEFKTRAYNLSTMEQANNAAVEIEQLLNDGWGFMREITGTDRHFVLVSFWRQLPKPSEENQQS
jgi:hypothetical protein